MDTTPSPAPYTRILRVDTRYRHRAQDLSSQKRSPSENKIQQKPQQEAVIEKKEAEQAEEAQRLHNDRGEPLLIREQNGRAVMGRAHRMFHRRAAQEAPAVLTVNVNVIETVDVNGNVIAQQTLPPGVPPPMPTVALPVVPSVPAFPSDLTVPAYPWPSGVPTVAEAAAPSSSAVDTLAAPTTVAPEASSAPVTPLFPSNSTISSTILSSSLSSISLSSISTSSSSSSSSASSSLSSSSRLSSSASQTASSSVRVPTSSVYGGGGGLVNTAASPSPTGAAVAADNSENKGPLDTPGVVGSVVGSLAGAALILAIILLLIKRHKRKQRGGALQLQDDASERDQVVMSQQPQSNNRNSLIPAYFLNRFSGASRSTADTSTTGERSFQRISGRKLPSAFSEGMTSEQFAASRGEGTLSGSSFYRDEKGFYGGPGVSKEFSKEIGEGSMQQHHMSTQERFMPSPARTPVIRHPDDAAPFALSPPQTPNPDHPPRGTLGRSHPSHDGSRSSRFTENV